MPSIKRFEEILAWQRAKELVREVYLACQPGQFSRDFGLRDPDLPHGRLVNEQRCRGFWSKEQQGLCAFFGRCSGSGLEVQSLLYVARDLNYINDEEFQRLYNRADEVISLIAGFTSYLRNTRVRTANPELRTPNS
jgi:four helix bundle protein